MLGEHDSHTRKFQLVDFAAHFQNGFRNHVAPITEIPALVEAFKHYGCYATYFFYSDEILTYMSAQPSSCNPTLAGFQGKVWAPYFPVDLDHSDLSLVLESAKNLLSLFLYRWQVDPNGVQVYFSGSKGFHLMLDTRLFGRIYPSKSLPRLFDSLRRHIAQELPSEQRETLDLSIKDRLRLLRLPNTIHEESGLYKVLIPSELLYTAHPEEVKELARKPRSLELTDETGLVAKVTVTESKTASGLFRRIRRQMGQITRKPFTYRFRRPEDLTEIDFPCAGVQGIWEGYPERGTRNNCAIRLASELRLLGLTEEETTNTVLEWNERNGIYLPKQEIRNVIRSAYQHRFPYRYGCRDEILRKFCPLGTLEECQGHVASHSMEHRTTGNSKIGTCGNGH